VLGRVRAIVETLLRGVALGAAADAVRRLSDRSIVELDGTLRVGLAVGVGLAIGAAVAALAVQVARLARGEADRFSAGRARLLLIAGVAALALHFAMLQPFDHDRLRVAAGIGLGAYAGASALAGLARRWAPRAVRAADLFLVNAALVLVGGEAALRGLAVLKPSPLLTQPDGSAARRVDEHRTAPGTIRWGFPCNAEGYYDEEFVPRDRNPAKLLAVSIGDSFAMGRVPHGWHFTTVAERRLGGAAAVYNLGVEGIGPREYAYLLEREALPLGPDVVVVNLFIGNDLAGSESPSRIRARLWLDRENLLVYQVPRRLLALRAGAGAADPETAGRPQGHSGQEGRLTDDEARERFAWLDDPMREEPSMKPAAFLAYERMRARQLGGPPNRKLAHLLHHVDEMRRLAGSTPLLFVLIPDEFQVEDDLWREVQAGLPGPPLDRDQPQRLLGEALRARGLPYLDLLPRLRAVPPLADGRRHVYHLCDTHWNARGNRVAGEALAEALAERALAPGR